MSDIRKRTGRKGTTYQVRYPSAATKAGYANKTFDTMKEARAWLESGGALSAGRSPVPDIDVKLGIQIWLDACEKEGRGGRSPVTAYTLKTYRYRAGIVLQYPWSKPLTELTAPDVVAFRSWLLTNHSRDQARKALSYFHSMVLELVHRGLLSHDFAAGVNISASTRYEEPVAIPTEKEIQQLLAAADRLANSKNRQVTKTWERYRPMLYLAVDSGMRPQEYLVVAKDAFNDRGVRVERALDAGGQKITVTKTVSGRRFIDLSPETVEMLQYYADHIACENEFDLAFPTSTGRWQSTKNWRRRGFAAACLEAGLVSVTEVDGKAVELPKYKPYDLRHFYASMLIENRVNFKRIQRLMGHSDMQTTLNIYGHVIERVEDEQESRTCLISNMSRIPCGESVARSL